MPRKIASPTERRPHFIKEWREHRGLTQQKLADRVGTSKQSISRIEKGEQPYTQESLEALADALNTSPADLISRDPQREPDLPIFDLPDSDRERLRKYVRALRLMRVSDDGSPLPELPDTPSVPDAAKQISRKKA